eukprot:132688-Rhodomonas_salina.1
MGLHRTGERGGGGRGGRGEAGGDRRRRGGRRGRDLRHLKLCGGRGGDEEGERAGERGAEERGGEGEGEEEPEGGESAHGGPICVPAPGAHTPCPVAPYRMLLPRTENGEGRGELGLGMVICDVRCTELGYGASRLSLEKAPPG